MICDLNFDVCLKYCSYRQNYFSFLTGVKLVDNAVPTIFSFTFEKKNHECTEKKECHSYKARKLHT